MTMRAMSYAMFLGNIPQVQTLIAKHGWPLKPESWYEPETLIKATMHKYNMSYE